MNLDFFDQPVPQSTYRQRRAKASGESPTPERALQPLPPHPHGAALTQRIQDQFEFIHHVMMPRLPINPQTQADILGAIYRELGLSSHE